jgi:ribosomal protein S12 methylthiotransferase accessory factor
MKSASMSGKGWSDGEARASCLGEATERHSAIFRGTEPCVVARYDDLRDRAVSPATLLQLSARQYASRDVWNAVFGTSQYLPEPWHEDDSLEWSVCSSLSTNSEVLVPAGACFLRYVPPQLKIIFPNETCGCAAAPTKDEAIVRAFLEIVERDAVALWWYNRCPRSAVAFDTFCDDRLMAAADYLARNGRSLHVLDLTSDFHIPVMAAISATSDGDAVLFGFSADFNAQTALLAAVAELFQILGPRRTWTKAAILQHYRLPVDRLAWTQFATLKNQKYLLPSSAPARTAAEFTHARPMTPEIRLEHCVAATGQLGLNLIVADLTRPSVGVPVVRVIVPGLRSSWPRLAPGRLYDVPVRLGWQAHPLPEEMMNPFPFFL